MKAIRGINSLNNTLSTKLIKGRLEALNKINLNSNKRFFHDITRTEPKNKSDNVLLKYTRS
jgi:hypothetical protein